MARYPDNPRPISPYNFRSNRPSVGGGPEWAPQNRPLTRFGLAEADVTYRGKSWAQVMTLYNFFESVDGDAGRFTFVDFNGIGPIGGTDPGVAWSGLYVAKGTGAVGTWDLPTYSLKANTTLGLGIIAAGTRTVTPISMAGIVVGGALTAVNGDGTNGEVVLVTATTATTFTAVFANGHGADADSVAAGGWSVNAPLVFENGVAKTTVFGSSIPAGGAYGIEVGAGTDGVDKLHAGTAPASTVILTIDATCRRAFRRAKFTASKNPFVLNVPANYYQGPLTIVEVRK